MKNKIISIIIGILMVITAVLVIMPTAYALHTEYEIGDVFASLPGGTVNWFLPDGTFNANLVPGVSSAYATGSVFDADGNLYVTMFGAKTVCKFDKYGTYLGEFGAGVYGDNSPESIIIDGNGDFYVGTVDGSTNDVFKLDSTGVLLAQYDVTIEDRGSDWIDLAADQHTLYYTSEDRNILRYDVSTSTQLANFNVALLPSTAFALRLLPTGGLLVADTTTIVRLDGAGNQIQTYDATGEDYWFALNLDPDGTSFWSACAGTGNIYRFDIATGTIIDSFNGGAAAVWGLSIFGEITVGQAYDVSIDIHPGSCPNPLNAKAKGVIPVAICGTDEFDVTTIDPSTIELEGVSPLRWSYEDVATPYIPLPPCGEWEICLFDEWGDGWNDNSIDVIVDSVIVLDDLTLLNGYGPECHTFTVPDGSTIEIQFDDSGYWDYECYFDLMDSEGNDVLDDYYPVDDGYYWSGTASCEFCGCHELNGDGYMDLSLKFDNQEVVAALGSINEGDVIPLTLTGNLLEDYGGTAIEGHDCMWVVKA